MYPFISEVPPPLPPSPAANGNPAVPVGAAGGGGGASSPAAVPAVTNVRTVPLTMRGPMRGRGRGRGGGGGGGSRPIIRPPTFDAKSNALTVVGGVGGSAPDPTSPQSPQSPPQYSGGAPPQRLNSKMETAIFDDKYKERFCGAFRSLPSNCVVSRSLTSVVDVRAGQPRICKSRSTVGGPCTFAHDQTDLCVGAFVCGIALITGPHNQSDRPPLSAATIIAALEALILGQRSLPSRPRVTFTIIPMPLTTTANPTTAALAAQLSSTTPTASEQVIADLAAVIAGADLADCVDTKFEVDEKGVIGVGFDGASAGSVQIAVPSTTTVLPPSAQAAATVPPISAVPVQAGEVPFSATAPTVTSVDVKQPSVPSTAVPTSSPASPSLPASAAQPPLPPTLPIITGTPPDSLSAWIPEPLLIAAYDCTEFRRWALNDRFVRAGTKSLKLLVPFADVRNRLMDLYFIRYSRGAPIPPPATTTAMAADPASGGVTGGVVETFFIALDFLLR